MDVYGGEYDLGVLDLALAPRRACMFRASPAYSLHAALLRRIELVDPDLSLAMHEGQQGAGASDHPWTISPLMGRLEREVGGLVATPDVLYRARITGLTSRVLDGLGSAFDGSASLGSEPLHLERVPFDVDAGSPFWNEMTSYASLLTGARPHRRIRLVFRSPTGFRTRQQHGLVPPPRLCVEGYLRKWNAFADTQMPAGPILEYVTEHVRTAEADLRPRSVNLRQVWEHGVTGEITWEADGEFPYMLRLLNALVDYGFYCGTGKKTAQGMGQTVRASSTRGSRL